MHFDLTTLEGKQAFEAYRDDYEDRWSIPTLTQAIVLRVGLFQSLAKISVDEWNVSDVTITSHYPAMTFPRLLFLFALHVPDREQGKDNVRI